MEKMSKRKQKKVIQKKFIQVVASFMVLGMILGLKANHMMKTQEVKASTLEYDEFEYEEIEDDLAYDEIQDEEETESSQEEDSLKYAYLTFDDGPSDNTPKILDFLKKNHIKATFFVVGKEGYDDIYKRIVDEGHTLAVHSNTHVYEEIYASVPNFMQDITDLSNRLENLTGVRPTVMRFPGGSNNTISNRYGGEGIMDELTQYVKDEGYQYFDWNVDSSDATAYRKDKDDIVNSVIDGIAGKKRAIILMHDAAAKTTTVDALPQIVKGIKKQGFILDSLKEDTPAIQFK